MNHANMAALLAIFLVVLSATAHAERLNGLRPSLVETADGLTLSVIESGETAGPAILFVHGFSQSAAVMIAKNLRDVVLVGWSYGGLPLLDYVQTHGQDNLPALVFVATGYNLDLRPPDAGGPEPVLGPRRGREHRAHGWNSGGATGRRPRWL